MDFPLISRGLISLPAGDLLGGNDHNRTVTVVLVHVDHSKMVIWKEQCNAVKPSGVTFGR